MMVHLHGEIWIIWGSSPSIYLQLSLQSDPVFSPHGPLLSMA